MEEETDYYFNEAGLMVFTAAYHLKRGYCCKNKCKHCPWRYGKDNNDSFNTKPPKKLEKGDAERNQDSTQ